MASTIDPTRPLEGAPASKADLRTNLQAAKDEIEALQVPIEQGGGGGFAGTALTVDAASFGAASEILIRCTSSSPVTITLAADVPFGKGVHVVQYGSGSVTGQAGASASLVKPAAASPSTSGQYDSLVFRVIVNGGAAAEWLVV
jgi:hypothetical protein